MRCSLIAVALMLVHGVAVEAQGPTFKLGTTPTEGELRPADAAIGPDGEGDSRRGKAPRRRAR